jgi:hypothetical protein
VSNKSALALGFQLTRGSDGTVTAATVPKGACNFDIVLGPVVLKPAPGQKNPILIDLLATLLKLQKFTDFIGTELGNVTCTTVGNLVNNNLTSILARMAAKVRPYLHPQVGVRSVPCSLDLRAG